MADFLTRLVERTLGFSSMVQPLIAPMYAQGSALVDDRSDLTILSEELLRNSSDEIRIEPGEQTVSASPTRNTRTNFAVQGYSSGRETASRMDVTSLSGPGQTHHPAQLAPDHSDVKARSSIASLSGSVSLRDRASSTAYDVPLTGVSSNQFVEHPVGDTVVRPQPLSMQETPISTHSSRPEESKPFLNVRERSLAVHSSRPEQLSILEKQQSITPTHEAVQLKKTRPQSAPYLDYVKSPVAEPREVVVEASSPASTIQVTIGRIEVKATPPPAPRPAARSHSTPPMMSLEDYLNRRTEGGHR